VEKERGRRERKTMKEKATVMKQDCVRLEDREGCIKDRDS
jgi:hypothetical protein